MLATMKVWRRTCLVVYDVLHALSLSNGRMRRDDLVAYLHRATTSGPTSDESRLRAFERFKKTLARLAISYRTELPHTSDEGETYFKVERVAEARKRIEKLL